MFGWRKMRHELIENNRNNYIADVKVYDQVFLKISLFKNRSGLDIDK